MSKYRDNVEIIKAIAHPVRLEIVDILSNGPECVCILAKRLGKGQPYTSQQLAILRDADLVTTKRQDKNILSKEQPAQKVTFSKISRSITTAIVQVQQPTDPRWKVGARVGLSSSG